MNAKNLQTASFVLVVLCSVSSTTELSIIYLQHNNYGDCFVHSLIVPLWHLDLIVTTVGV